MARPELLPLLLILPLLACGQAPTQEEVLARFPITSLEGVLTRSGVEFDPGVSSDGNGSLRITSEAANTFRLFETGDLDVEAAVVHYSARLRTEEAAGPVYLEMWAVMPGGGEYFSRALDQPLTGSVEWTTQRTPFLFEAGQNPENLRLNVVVGGAGTVWVDDVRVTATR